MKSLGMWMAIFGGGSFLLNMAGREFILLMWIDLWGPMIGNVIRVALIGIGVALFIAGAFMENNNGDVDTQNPSS
jgi:hypothetical protein